MITCRLIKCTSTRDFSQPGLFTFANVILKICSMFRAHVDLERNEIKINNNIEVGAARKFFKKTANKSILMHKNLDLISAPLKSLLMPHNEHDV